MNPALFLLITAFTLSACSDKQPSPPASGHQPLNLEVTTSQDFTREIFRKLEPTGVVQTTAGSSCATHIFVRTQILSLLQAAVQCEGEATANAAFSIEPQSRDNLCQHPRPLERAQAVEDAAMSLIRAHLEAKEELLCAPH